MDRPLVSVVTPTYRRPQYLREALESVVGQTYENLQIIVRDNASGDETPDVVRAFNDPRIEFYQAERTGSGWENGTECLRRVRGKYLIQVCDDDRIGSTYVETLVRFLEEDNRILAAYGATDLIDENGKVIRRYKSNGTVKWTAPQLIEAWCTDELPLASGVNSIRSMSFVKALGQRHCFVHGHNSDNAVFTTAAIRGYALFTDECVFSYRKHPQNSGNSFRYHERMEGDRDFLTYLDSEVMALSNVNLPRSDWPRLRRQLRTMLASHYYHLFREHHLHNEGMSDVFRASVFEPMKSYGLANCLKLLRQEKSFLLDRVRQQIRLALFPSTSVS